MFGATWILQHDHWVQTFLALNTMADYLWVWQVWFLAQLLLDI